MVRFYNDNKELGYALVGDTVVWSTYPQEKVLQDEFDIYKNEMFKPSIDVYGVKNEYANGQIIISAKQNDVKSFNFYTADLIDGKGNIFSKDNFNVYNMLYVIVHKNFHGGRQPVGRYPECLVPFNKAIEWGENCVKKNENQSIWVRVYIPKEQQAGEYTGKFILEIDGVKQEIPVTIKVADYLLTDKNHTWSWFTIGSSGLERGEGIKDNVDIYDIYVEELLKHRLSPDSCINSKLFKDPYEMIKPYADKVYEMIQKYDMSTVAIHSYETIINGYKDFKPDYLELYIDALYEKSLETHFNILDRAVMYDWIIDEPFLIKYPEEQVKQHCNNFKSVINKCVEKHKNDNYADIAFRDELIQSIKDLPQLVTDYYQERYKDDINCLCPKFDGCDTEEDREKYKNQKKKWWYNCNEPNAPYASYHTEDMLMSARMIDWQGIRYGFRGNLYWLVNFYANAAGLPLGACYDPSYDYSDRGICNGDALLFYPGKLYGLKEPLLTNKIEAIRDGQQDYELLYWIIEKYKESDVDFFNVMDFLTADLYKGSQVIGTEKEFVHKRNILVDLVEKCNLYGFMIKSIKEVGDELNLEVLLDNKYSLICDGKVQVKGKLNNKNVFNVQMCKNSYVDVR